MGVPTQFTPIVMESRRVVEVTDVSTGTTTSFAEPSPYITTEELGRLAADYRALIDGASGAVLCGGVPDALPPETFATFATYAAEAGVPVVLDAGGSALAHGVARRRRWSSPRTHPARAHTVRTCPARALAARPRWWPPGWARWSRCRARRSPC